MVAALRAENDIQQATALARQMVTRWGMSDELGPVTLAPRDDLPAGFGTSKPYSEATARRSTSKCSESCRTATLRRRAC